MHTIARLNGPLFMACFGHVACAHVYALLYTSSAARAQSVFKGMALACGAGDCDHLAQRIVLTIELFILADSIFEFLSEDDGEKMRLQLYTHDRCIC